MAVARWVLAAFAADKPFDEFTIEQLAGDLLPNATLEQRIASGFHRNTMVNFENGAIAAEYLVEYAADRVAATGAVWLGQTLACARCHDHKYDPVSQQDYYRLFAFFNQTSEVGVDGDRGNAAPFIAAPTDRQARELVSFEQRLHELHQQLDSKERAAATAARSFSAADVTDGAAVRRSPADAWITASFDELNGNQTVDAVTGRTCLFNGPAIAVPGKSGGAVLCDGATAITLPALPPTEALTWSAWLFFTTPDRQAIAALRDEQGRHLAAFSFDQGAWNVRVGDADEPSPLPIETPLRTWTHIALLLRRTRSGLRVGWAVNGELPSQPPSESSDGEAGEPSVDVKAPTVASLGSLRGTWHVGAVQDGLRGIIDEVRLFPRALDADELAALADADPDAAALALPPARRSEQQVQRLARRWLAARDAEYQALLRERDELVQRRQSLVETIPTTMVMDAVEPPRNSFVLHRGQYDQPGQPVQAGVPELWGPFPADAPRNRWGLARWLVSPHNPLTARVAVNRLWQQFFGEGLVRTAEDFGTRGEPPTNPELLDWLAVEFREHGWNVRHIQRLTANQAALPLAASPFQFAPHGASGIELSELLPHTARVADELCLIRSLHTEAINHDPAITFMHTGSQQPGRASMGAWRSYGLGSANANLPAFVVLVSGGQPGDQPGDQPLFGRLWGAGFLPGQHQGVRLRGGLVYGATDEFGYNIVEKPVHVHDLQATILHCLGIDHEQLTFRFEGRDYRLTDIAGSVVTDLMS